ncbi:MAG: hypothetical protein IAG13_37780 [Deltaproteobacteria bacterium]|nr:hypothetical protein [Nannocystaceae bacterium]
MTQPSTTPYTLLLPLAELAFVAVATIACDAQVDPDYSGEPLATLRGDVDADGNPDADVGVLWFQTVDGTPCSGPVFSCDYAASGMIGQDIDEACLEACDEEFAECSDTEQADAFEQCNRDCGVDMVTVTPTLELCVNAAIGERVPVQGEFPAMFSLELFTPPPDAALLADDGGYLGALAVIIAVDPDAEEVGFDENNQDVPPSILGTAPEQALFYAESDIPADSAWGRYLNGAYSAGYHLLEFHREPSECPGYSESECGQWSVWYTPAPADLDTPLTLVFAPPHELEWPLI